MKNKIKQILDGAEDKYFAETGTEEDFKIVFDMREKILWVGKSGAHKRSEMYEPSPGIIVESDDLGDVQSIAVINPENHRLFKTIFKNLKQVVSHNNVLRYLC